MAQFSYKGEEFPYSPKEIHLSAAKRLGQFPLAFGGAIIQQLGKELLEISGTGELTGDLAGEFARLYRLFSQSDSGILQLPGFSPIHCYFTALEGVGQPGPAVLEYRFTFVEDPAYADILGASGARSAQLLEGETLYTLARRLGVNAAELIAANPQIADPMSPERGSTVWLP